MSEIMTAWKELIIEEMERHGEKFEYWIAVTPKDFDFDKEFSDGLGIIEGEPFTLWTQYRVYFPCEYDGSEWVGSVPRNPCDEITNHIGGENDD